MIQGSETMDVDLRQYENTVSQSFPTLISFNSKFWYSDVYNPLKLDDFIFAHLLHPFNFTFFF